LSSIYVADLKEHTISSSVNAKKDVFSKELGTVKDMVSIGGWGSGDQFFMYIKRDLFEKTKGNFTVYLENLNNISYAAEK